MKSKTSQETMATLVYAIGDIHGRHALLTGLWRKIAADAERHLGPGEQATVVFLGDYIDRGPDSARVLTWCARLHRHPPKWCVPVFLMGNHEQLMLALLQSRDPEVLGSWLRNGADATLESLGIQSRVAAEVAVLLLRSFAKHHLLQWLPSLQLSHQDGSYLFVHAGIRPGVQLVEQNSMDCLWIGEEFLDSAIDHGLRVVHGHSPTSDACVDVRPNRINVDTGACYCGVLSAVRLRGDAVGRLQARDPPP